MAGMHPQFRSAGELVRLANMLSEEFRKIHERWQTAIGMDLETAEAVARAERVETH